MIYLVHFGAIIAPGVYIAKRINKNEFMFKVNKYYEEGKLINALGFEKCCELINKEINTRFKVERRSIDLRSNDIMLVMKLKTGILKQELIYNSNFQDNLTIDNYEFFEITFREKI